MVTTKETIGSSYVQLTDGTQAYALSVHAKATGSVRITLNDGTPADDTADYFTLKNNEGISHLTHDGKVWAKSHKPSDDIVIILNK